MHQSKHRREPFASDIAWITGYFGKVCELPTTGAPETTWALPRAITLPKEVLGV
jgi:hypothetical protein